MVVMTRPVPTSFRLKPDLKVALEKAATADGRSVSNLVERVLTEWLTSKGFFEQPNVPMPPEQQEATVRRVRKMMER